MLNQIGNCKIEKIEIETAVRCSKETLLNNGARFLNLYN